MFPLLLHTNTASSAVFLGPPAYSLSTTATLSIQPSPSTSHNLFICHSVLTYVKEICKKSVKAYVEEICHSVLTYVKEICKRSVKADISHLGFADGEKQQETVCKSEQIGWGYCQSPG